MDLIWEFIKRNIFVIVLLITLVVAVPWSLLFILPVVVLFIVIFAVIWRLRRAQKRMYDEFNRQAGREQQQQQQTNRSWWQKQTREGDVTIVQTEHSEPRVNDEVGEYVEFKEVKEKDDHK